MPVEAHVLPEIDQLQAGADGVGLFQVLRAGGVEQMQHQPADRIGRARAVVQQRGVILVARDGDVLFEGRQQVVERRDRQLVARDGGRQRRRSRASAGSPGRSVAPGSAPMRCSSARRPPAAVAVRRRWQALRRRYRPRRGRTGRYRSRRSLRGSSSEATGNSRSDRWAWSCVAVGGAGVGAVPGLCPAKYAGPHVLALIVVIPCAFAGEDPTAGIPPRSAGMSKGADGVGARAPVLAGRRSDRAAADPAPPSARGERRRRLGIYSPLLRISPSCRVPYPPPFPFPRLPTTRHGAPPGSDRRRPRGLPPSIWAVIKANAYGHGIEQAVAGVLLGAGAGDAGPDEAVRCREAGWGGPILLLEGFSSPPTWTSSTAIT